MAEPCNQQWMDSYSEETSSARWGGLRPHRPNRVRAQAGQGEQRPLWDGEGEDLEQDGNQIASTAELAQREPR